MPAAPEAPPPMGARGAPYSAAFHDSCASSCDRPCSYGAKGVDRVDEPADSEAAAAAAAAAAAEGPTPTPVPPPVTPVPDSENGATGAREPNAEPAMEWIVHIVSLINL